jgi:alkylated DNA repair protein (DNA oxidative demethylase)
MLKRRSQAKPQGLIYKPNYLNSSQRTELLQWLSTLHPIWENRYSESNPPPEGAEQRRLLRPVYWLGNWQFACLNYFHPPKNIYNCCIEAEPFAPLLQYLAHQIEEEVHSFYPERDIPRGWHFNTCLINFYGHSIDQDNKKHDTARVGEHKDFEPGPVGSLSLGERALFQFVDSRDRSSQSHVVLQQWLDDSSLQVFGGERFKKRLFHRVQRVDHKSGNTIGPKIQGFETRRINFTFRYVPNEFIIPFAKLPDSLQKDIYPYVKELSEFSPFFHEVLSTPLAK